MYLVKVGLFAVLLAIVNADPVARLSGGLEVDTLSQFPHHVYIIPYLSGRKCGGSILNNQWVLSSASCIKNSARLELTFGKQKEFDQNGGHFTISVNSDQVYAYPTNYDDLALIRLPMQLVFSDSINAVNISRLPVEALRNKFAVMPGFNEGLWITTLSPNYDNLRYGMFTVLEQSACKQSLGAGNFDEYTQLCTESWGANLNTPCDSDYGSGLMIGWPANSELIGMFSMFSSACDRWTPSVYTYVGKYLPWIESMIQG